MSLYSGFETQQLESKYNRTVAQLLQLLQSHLLRLLAREPVEIKSWTRSFAKAYKTLHSLEESREVHPKFSLYCTELADYFGLHSNFELQTNLELSDHASLQLADVHTHSFYAPVKHLPAAAPGLNPIHEKPQRSRSTFKLRPNEPTRVGSEKRLQVHTPHTRMFVPRLEPRRKRRVKRNVSSYGNDPFEVYHSQAMWKLSTDQFSML